MDCAMVPCMEALTCGSPRMLRPTALVVDRTAGGGASGGGGVGGQGAERTAGSDRHFEEREIQAAGDSAALGAQEFGIADGQKVALEFDIEVVLDGQGKRILRATGRGSRRGSDRARAASFRSVRRESCAVCRACSRFGRTRDRPTETAPGRRGQSSETFSSPTASCRARLFPERRRD